MNLDDLGPLVIVAATENDAWLANQVIGELKARIWELEEKYADLLDHYNDLLVKAKRIAEYNVKLGR